jgi:Protein of unknown function (DUF3037)
MGISYKYALVQFAAHPLRGELLNIGLIVFLKKSLDIWICKRLDRIKAISAAVDTDGLRDAILNLNTLDKFVREEGAQNPEERLSRLGELAPFKFTHLGAFDAISDDAYKIVLSSLMQRLVEPEPPLATVMKVRRSVLLSEMKKTFRTERVLAQKGEDLSSHRIVPNHKIADGYAADLVLQNGSMHVIQTVHANTEELSFNKIKSDIALSALVFEVARMSYSKTETKLVYQASPMLENIAKPALLAAEHQGAELFNWESDDDRIKFIYHISSLATPLEKKSKSKKLLIHASTQPKFNLN